ncbi:MAG: hypothetical protein WCW04_03455 [Candidatus Paceibacterota bacterium]
MEYKPENRICQNCKNDFTIETDDFSFYEKMKVPAPTFCPKCRRQRRFAWRNYINFYHRKDINGKDVISLYSPESNIPVLNSKDWNNYAVDMHDYGVHYDFSKSFFNQYFDLLKRVPRLAMDNDDGLLSKNCQYTNDFLLGKNCYLVIKAWKLEDVMYSFYVVNSKNLVDVCTSFGKDEGNYETVNTKQCYQCKFIIDSQSCMDCLYSYDLRNCSSCLLCSNIRGKKYCYRNEQYTKEKYEEILKSYKLNTYSGAQKCFNEFNDLYKQSPKKSLRMINCKNSLGDLLVNCNNCHECFCILESENASYCNFADGVKDSLDADASGGSELAYESDLTDFCYRVIGSYFSTHCRDSYYISNVHRSKNCFGCSGLRDAEYCILNKQYKKEEYEELLPKIINHMIEMPYIDKKGNKHYFGDFPPIELSYFGYNDSVANDVFTLNEKEIKENGFVYQENQHRDNIEGALSIDNIPDDINNVKDDILNNVYISNGRQYRITQDELSFYRKYQIPIPRESFYDRFARRSKLMTSFKLYKSKSSKSGEEIITSHNPNDELTVYSIDEYKKEFE